MNPIQTTIESLHTKQRCPRLHVDTTRPGIVCPDFVRERWKEQLVIDLDPQYPLELEFTEVGVEANLSFGGFVTRCVFPWEAVYVVVDRDTGRGLVIESIVPPAVRARQAAAARQPPPPAKPKLAVASEVAPEPTPLAKPKAAEERKSHRHRRKKGDATLEAGEDTAAEAASDAEASEATAKVDVPAQTEAPEQVDAPVKVEQAAQVEAPAKTDASTREDEAKRRRAAFRVVE